MSHAPKDPHPAIVCIAGFGDNAQMFDALLSTDVASRIRFIPLDLPGFGSPALDKTSLDTLAEYVLEFCREESARSLMAHSVASIIASLAAKKSEGDIQRIISLEGNLTADDAYFSGTAADFDDADEFKAAFLKRLMDLGDDPIIVAYRKRVAQADPHPLWELGCDARQFSKNRSPGETLIRSADVLYLYNPKNCPDTSNNWLETSAVGKVVLDGASHWPTVDQPKTVADLTEGFLRS